jgi:trimethylguanosine synthase
MQEKFSRLMKGDPDALFMSVQEVAALHVARRLKKFTSCVELCCAVGAMAIHIARFIPKVYAIDIDSQRIADAKINAQTYNVVDNVIFITGDVLNEALLKDIKAEVAILDPDWSEVGIEKSDHTVDIDKMQPSMRQMILLTQKYITSNIVIRVPKYFTLATLDEFGAHELESVYIDDKLKFKIVYFLPHITTSIETAVHLQGLQVQSI